MTVENISWSISTKECCRPRRGLNPRPPGLQSDSASNWATEAGQKVLISFLFFHKNLGCGYSLQQLTEVLPMSTNNIGFCGGIRNISAWYSLLSGREKYFPGIYTGKGLLCYTCPINFYSKPEFLFMMNYLKYWWYWIVSTFGTFELLKSCFISEYWNKKFQSNWL